VYRRAGIAVFFLAPFVGELLSTSAPPAEYFNPIGFVILHVLYGGGALLIWELVRSRRGGVWRLLLLGVAYGLAEEALMCKSVFDPAWPDLGSLDVYGRALGVNWVWAVELTIYHAVYSIAIPIGIVCLVWPQARGRAWIGRRGRVVLAVLWVLNGVFLFAAITPYRPPALQYGITMVLVVVLVLIACKRPGVTGQAAGLDTAGRIDRAAAGEPLPHPLHQAESEAVKPPMRAIWFGLVGWVASLAFFLSAWVLSKAEVPVGVTVGAIVGVPVAVVLLVRRLSGGRWRWWPRPVAALITGALAFLVFLCVVRANQPDPVDNPHGLGIVAVVVVIGLVAMNIRVARMTRRCASARSSSRRPEADVIRDGRASHNSA